MIFQLMVVLALQGDAEVASPPASNVLFETEKSIHGALETRDGKALVIKIRDEVVVVDARKWELSWQETVPPMELGVVSDGIHAPLLAVSEDSVFIGSNMMSPAVEVRSLKTGAKITSFGSVAMGKKAVEIAVDRKGRWVWFGLSDGKLARSTVGNVNGWSTRDLRTSKLTCIASDSKEKTVALGCGDGSVRFVGFSSASVEKKTVFEAEVGPITAIAFAGKGKDLVVAGKKGKAAVLSAKGKVKQTFQGPALLTQSMVLHPKSKWAAFGYTDGSIHVFSWKSGERIAELKHEGASEGVVSLMVLNKGKTLVSVGGKSIRSWDASEWK